MEHVINLFNAIENTSSRNDKMDILRSNRNDKLFRDILDFVFNPFIVTGISKKKIAKDIKGYPTIIDSIEELMEYLRNHNTGRDEDVLTVQVFAYTYIYPEIREFIFKLASKDFSIGITADSINKAFGEDFIPVFDVMLAQPFERFYSDVACEVKIDGTRCLTIKQGNSVNMFTRNGKLISGFDEIIEQIKSLPIDTIVLDGELYGKDYIDTMNKLFRKVSGKQANYMIFDTLTLDEFKAGISDSDYFTRKETLKNVITDAYDNLVRIDPFKIIKNATPADIDEATQYAMSMGFEGAMIKPLDGKYECKRSYTWQKSKVFESDEFKIIDFEEGDGKYKGTLGKVIVDVNGIGVGVGSGWTDADRSEIWGNKDRYLGSLIEVRYQEKTKDNSLRFPTVKGFRVDK